MISLSDLELFSRTAAAGNLSQAAREMEITPAAASACLKRLEKRLETRLFIRTTRNMRLTTEGDGFLNYCREALNTLEEGIAFLGQHKGSIQGSIRLSAPSDFGRLWVIPWLNEFQSRNPKVDITLLMTDRISNFYHDTIDLAVRYGQLQDSSMVAVPLAENHRVLCAAPQYLEQHGTPLKPQDLQTHNCLTFALEQKNHDLWKFSKGNRQFEIRVQGNRRSDDGSVARQWAIDGFGITYKSWLDVAQDIESNRLKLILETYQGESAPVYLVYPHRQYMAPALRILIDFIKAQAQELPKHK